MTHHHKHAHRDDLTGEHPRGDIGQLVLTLIFFTVWIADTFFFKLTTFLNDDVPIIIRIPFGVLFLFLALYLARAGLSIVFGEVQNKPGVIRERVFNIVRHPVYLSEILLYLGFVILSISLAALVVCIMAFLFLHLISRYEERLLLERFGEEYNQYMQEVPMWIPRLWKK